MKLIIAGSRGIRPEDALPLVRGWINTSINPVTEFVTGDCPNSPDMVPYLLQKEIFTSGGTFIPIAKFPANWQVEGKAAGFIRNRRMAEYGDILLLLWDGKSRGSLNMKQNMEKLNKPISLLVMCSALF